MSFSSFEKPYFTLLFTLSSRRNTQANTGRKGCGREP